MSTVAEAPAVTTAPVKGSAFKKKIASAPAQKTDPKPTIHCEGPLAEAIEACIRLTGEEKSVKALFDANKQQVIAGLRGQYLDLCRRRGEAVSSVSLVTPRVKATYISSCMYGDITPDREEMLRSAFAADFDRYFTTAVKVTLKKESASDQGVLDAIEAALGSEFVERHFDGSSVLKVTAALHNDLATRAEVRSMAEELVQTGVISQYTPSVRLGA
jgi:phosphoribosylformylglycinamidine (FGAM) synthase PurS component